MKSAIISGTSSFCCFQHHSFSATGGRVLNTRQQAKNLLHAACCASTRCTLLHVEPVVWHLWFVAVLLATCCLSGIPPLWIFSTSLLLELRYKQFKKKTPLTSWYWKKEPIDYGHCCLAVQSGGKYEVASPSVTRYLLLPAQLQRYSHHFSPASYPDYITLSWVGTLEATGHCSPEVQCDLVQVRVCN